MSDISQVRTRIDQFTNLIERLAANHEHLCETTTTASVATETRPSALAELEAAKREADALKKELAALKNKSKLDPEVLALGTKLDQALSRYYWLWQKCKGTMV